MARTQLERLADRAEIQDCIYRWCRAIDRLDYEAVRGCFHPDATDDHGPFNGDIDGLIEWIRDRHRGIHSSMHLVGNMLIEFSDDDTTIVESYVLCVQRYSAEGAAGLAQISGGGATTNGGPTDLLIVVRYLDRFERRHGEWRIATRTVAFDNIVQFAEGSATPRIGDGWPLGTRRDRSDPIYRLRTAAGLTD